MPRDGDDSPQSSDVELVEHFVAFARSAHPRAPLYTALSNLVARDPDLYRLLDHAPVQQRLPVLLFASAHALLLEEPGHELARWYPNLTDDHRSPTERALAGAFTRFVADHRVGLEHLVAMKGSVKGMVVLHGCHAPYVYCVCVPFYSVLPSACRTYSTQPSALNLSAS